MERLINQVEEAKARVQSFVCVARAAWALNALIGFVAFLYGRYDITAICSVSFLLSLTAAALGRRALVFLAEEQLVDNEIETARPNIVVREAA